VDIKQRGIFLSPPCSKELRPHQLPFLSASSLPQTPAAPIGPVFVEALNKLIPDELSLETFNSQYLQRNSSKPRAVFGAAQVLQKLSAPLSEIESVTFGLLGEDVKLTIPVRLRSLFSLSSSSFIPNTHAVCRPPYWHCPSSPPATPRVRTNSEPHVMRSSSCRRCSRPPRSSRLCANRCFSDLPVK